MLVKFLINKKLFAFETNDVSNDWMRIIDFNIVKMCDFVCIGSDIIKARSPNKYLMHAEINDLYDNGLYKKLPIKSLANSKFNAFVELNLSYKCDSSQYSYSPQTIYNIFDDLYTLHKIVY